MGKGMGKGNGVLVSCKDCRFWGRHYMEKETTAEQYTATCRYNPPVTVVHNNFVSVIFPLTQPDCFCGKGRPLTKVDQVAKRLTQ